MLLSLLEDKVMEQTESNNNTNKSKWIELITIGLIDRFADILAEKLTDEAVAQLTENVTEENVEQIMEKIIDKTLKEMKGTSIKE